MLRQKARLDGFLEFLGGAEGDLLAGLDLDRLAGGGVAAHARGALANLQDAEADDADAFALLEMLGHARYQIAEDGLGLLLRQFVLFGQCRREMLERNGGRGRCFLRHIWPSSLLMAWEPKTYQALNDSGGPCLCCFADKQGIICIARTKVPDWQGDLQH